MCGKPNTQRRVLYDLLEGRNSLYRWCYIEVNLVDCLLIQPGPFECIQVRVQKFLGRIGGSAHLLVSEVDLLQVTGTGGLAWDPVDRVKFALPFREDKFDIWLGTFFLVVLIMHWRLSFSTFRFLTVAALRPCLHNSVHASDCLATQNLLVVGHHMHVEIDLHQCHSSMLLSIIG